MNKINNVIDLINASRSGLLQRVGMQFGTNRDVYASFGYDMNPLYRDYFERYKRQDIASKVVDSFPNRCWRLIPVVRDMAESENETDFEKRWEELTQSTKLLIYSTLKLADIISGIGRFGLIYVGFNDVQSTLDIMQPVISASEILYLRVFPEGSVQIDSYVRDITSPYYGWPEVYSIAMNVANAENTVKVHYSRVIHIAENPLENPIYGSPRMEKVLNRLFDLEKLVGGSAEMFWQGAFPGYNFKLDPDAQVGPEEKTAMRTQIDEYRHSLRRDFTLQGITVESLAMQVASPKEHFEIQIALIAAATGIPKKMLIGTERGELNSSTDDDTNFLQEVDTRRTNFCEPIILRAFIDRLIAVGVLPEAQYNVDWPDLFAKGEKETSAIAKTWSEVFKIYRESSLFEIIPFDVFLSRVCAWDKTEVDEIMERIENTMEIDLRQEEKDLDITIDETL